MGRVAIVLCLVLASASIAEAATIDVLWYTGGVGTNPGGLANYKAEISLLSGLAATAPISVQNTWNITFWDGGAMPVGAFDVLVVASETGSWSPFPNYASLLAASITYGDRIMVSGQDADWHFANTSGHQTTFNSSQGFIIDAVNWAGSGTGMGAVFMNSPLPASVNVGLGTRIDNHGESVIIPAEFATFPINEGLTTSGLSNWANSHHDVWTGWNPALWTSINTTNDVTGGAVTLVSASTASGGTDGTPVPEPATALLFGLAASAVAVARRRRKA